MDLYPLTFEPRLLPKIWGGRRMEKIGKSLPPNAMIGESWEVCDRPEYSSVVADGPLKGRSLGELCREFGPHLLGRRLFEKDPAFFPLLIKFIDAGDRLSVQVHPDDEYAALHVGPDEPGKTEMWVVLAADKGALINAGLKKGVTRESFKKALAAGQLEEALNFFPVKAGDVVDVPAGRVHAIGKGVMLAEIQQSSDTTYRVWDYNRLENGKPRALHVDKALETIRFDEEMASMPDKVRPVPGGMAGVEKLVACPYFTVERITMDKEKPSSTVRKPAAQEGFTILMGLKGNAALESGRHSGMILRPGLTVLVPAALDWRLDLSGESAVVLSARVDMDLAEKK